MKNVINNADASVKISVIIPVYNAEKSLKKCIDSVLSQSLKELELICVDDCSQDKSYEIMQEYAQQDSRVIIIRNETNLRAGKSRNKGIDAASGEYLYFLDADDYLLPGALSTMYNIAAENEADILRAKAQGVDISTGEKAENKRYEMKSVPPEKMNVFLSFHGNENLFLKKITVAPWGGIIRKNYVTENHLYFNSLMCVNDRSFFINSLLHTDRIMLIDDYIVCHTTNNPDSLISKRAQNYTCHFESYEIIKKIISNETDDTKAFILESEIDDMISWFSKFKYDFLDNIYPITKKFLLDHSNDIDLVKQHFDGYITKPWYRIYSEIVELSKDEFEFKYGTNRNIDLLDIDEVKATRNRVPIHNLINFNSDTDEKIKVSVVVPVCNVEQYLRECLDSIVNQTLREIEIICVNDGSKDNSLEILKEYAAIDKRVKVIDKDNAGYGHTMNIGIDMAKGEYIGIVESDDFVLPEMYEELYNVAEANHVDFVKSDFNRFIRNENTLSTKLFKICDKDSDYNKIIKPFDYLRSFWFVKNTWSGIYRTEFLRRKNIRHNETPGASFQDNGFWFKTFAEAEKCYFVKKAYYMNRRDNPNSSVYDRKKAYCMVDEFKYIRRYIESSNILMERYKYVYHARKLAAYQFAINLICEEDKYEFIKYISTEFKGAIDNNEIDSRLFLPHELDEFEWIANNPDDYYSQHCENSIKVSVIIPVYNSGEYLKECLDSVLNQTLKEIEVICIDDGSEDDSLNILQEYEKNDSRLKLLTQEHGGGGAARNKGLAIARGEYLSFLDSDDFFELDMLESIYKKCKKTHSDIGVFKVKRYDNNTKETYSDSGSFVEANFPKKEFFSPSEIGEQIFSTFQTWAWNKLFRKHFIEKESISFQEINRTNDMYFVNTALIKAKRITTLNRALVYYRVGTKNNCQSTNYLYPKDFFSALLALQEEIKCSENVEIHIGFENLAVRSCIYNLNSLTDADAFADLYHFLHSEGFQSDKIDIASIDEQYIFKQNIKQYRECLKILNCSYEEYMFEKLIYFRTAIEKDKQKIKSLEEKSKAIANKNNIENTLNNVNEGFEKCKREITDIKSILKKTIDENKQYACEIINIRASISFKVGLFITWLPRKIRGIFKKS